MSRRRILIVDDERDLVDAYVRLLTRAGHICFGAFDADQALALMESERPNLVITDLSLPKTNGLAIVRRAKVAGSAVIVMTGHNTPELAKAAREEGASACLLKPVSIAELKRVIQATLEKPNAPQSA